jgi:RNA polymerase sigma-70 factor (sigma-E family)
LSEVTVTRERTEHDDFDAFVAARGGALWRTAWLLTGDHHKAEDLVQTALGKAWPHWDRLSREGSFEAYVRRVLFTTYVAWWRRRWNGELPSAAVPEADADDGAVQVAQRRDLMAALAELPKGQRAVVVLRYFEDLTEAETADVLQCSVGTVKSQSARALAALRTSRHLVAREGGAE